MKINVTYEAVDIERLVRADLIKQGMQVSSADIKFEEGVVHVAIVATVDDVPAPTVPAPPATAPSLAIVEGGNQPVDMSDVLGASASVAANKKPLYPPGERPLMEGESTEFPGVPRR
jgi:hypothetical protein